MYVLIYGCKYDEYLSKINENSWWNIINAPLKFEKLDIYISLLVLEGCKGIYTLKLHTYNFFMFLNDPNLLIRLSS